MSPRHLKGAPRPEVDAPARGVPVTGSDAGTGAAGPSSSDRFATSLADSVGGWRGMIDSGLPIVVFVVVNAVTRLTPAIWAALGAGAVILLFRLMRKESPQQAISGFVGVAIAAFIAHRTGHARDYFLVGIIRNGAIGLALLISAVVRWPIVGVLWEYLEGRGTAWRTRRALLRIYDQLTLMWAAVFVLRFALQMYFYHRDEAGWLAVVSLILGYPLFIAAALVTVVVVRRVAPPGRISRRGDAAADPPASDDQARDGSA
ncbi:MAG: DUF3159 domain-containing protein [Mycobacteriales bacterium]